MEKLKMQTPNIVEQNIQQIEKLFPNVITEIKDDDGNLKKGIDFDLLKQSLSDVLVDDENERYRLDWPGKKASLLKANTPITKTLRPCIEESVDSDKTENLYIEGDNFEVLKILQESYLGKVKMIYIDPPYNTGSDFIYKDDFKISNIEYDENIGATAEDGDKLFKNTDANGRFHSDWLSMLYERLLISRDLLKDDGFIFISIDENEQHNCKLILNEVFGSDNLICEFIWKNKHGGGGDSPYAVKEHEYIFCYSKNISNIPTLFISPPPEYEKMFREEDERGKFYYDRLDKKGIDANRPNLIYPIECPDGSLKDISPAIWRLSKTEFMRRKNLNQIGFKKDKNNLWQIYTKTYLHNEKGERRRVKARSILKQDVVGFTQNGNKEITSIMGGKYLQNPKPISLIKYFIDFVCRGENDIILDFFSGSATTAQAMMEINIEDNRKHRFILIQLQEKNSEKSLAYKAGYKTIAEIGKERIRRAGQKIKEENKDKEGIENLDIGFRVYKTDSTNMENVFYHPEEQTQLFAASNIKEDRTPDDLLTQVILDLGLELSLPIEKKKISTTSQSQTVYFVQHNSLVACFDDNVNFEIIDEIAEIKPLKVVFKDSSFTDDKDRINCEERFKRLSPKTLITVI